MKAAGAVRPSFHEEIAPMSIVDGVAGARASATEEPPPSVRRDRTRMPWRRRYLRSILMPVGASDSDKPAEVERALISTPFSLVMSSTPAPAPAVAEALTAV